MIEARFYIGDEPIQYQFDEVADMNIAINDLAMLYLEKMRVLPITIFLSYDLYKIILQQAQRNVGVPPIGGITTMQFMTSNGIVLVKPVGEPKERFIYAGNQQGYENSLLDKKFEEMVLGVCDET